jgi:flagellar biogenesis protein FliO
MDKKHSRSSDPKKNKLLSEPEIDYSPKPTTRGEDFLLGVKMSAIIAFIVGLLWIVEKYIF